MITVSHLKKKEFSRLISYECSQLPKEEENTESVVSKIVGRFKDLE